MQKYYRRPWSKEKVDLLEKWWPHFGTYGMSDLLEISRKKIKAKVNKLRLKLLPKNQRLCFECRERFQHSRGMGIRCRECHLKRRKQLRIQEQNALSKEALLDRWIKRATNTANHRSGGNYLTYEFMVELWNKQKGLCYYSDLPMITPKYGDGRTCFSPSIDRIDSLKTYTPDNVVWCTWVCNAGKSTMSAWQYIEVCKSVASKWENEECGVYQV